jgi:diguanylate cyclase (GGDEF)-like protein/PAS domain S-box-containing protein
MPTRSRPLHIVVISKDLTQLKQLRDAGLKAGISLHITQHSIPEELMEEKPNLSTGYVLFESVAQKRQYESKLRPLFPVAVFDYVSTELLLDSSLKEHLHHIIDISTARHQAAFAYDRLSMAAQIIESALEGIFIIDRLGIIRLVNPSFSALTGYFPEVILGVSLARLSSTNSASSLEHRLFEIIAADAPWEGELLIRTIHGQDIPLHATVSPLHSDQKARQYVVMFTDISEMKSSQERLERLAYFDSVTNLPNRAQMQRQLAKEIMNATSRSDILAVLYLDLDRFKTVNDTLGHTVGDVLLQKVAARLTEHVQPGTTLARLGGDEFALLVPRLQSLEEASQVAENIIEAMQEPFLCNSFEVHITPSLGISLYPSNGGDATTLFKNAEIALYRAKKFGGNTYQMYTPTLNPRGLERFILENSLRHALGKNQFVLYYQPQISVQNGNITGVEALIRWQHPEFGLISPAEFLPLAEETGLILPISEWVLSTACAQAAEWHMAGHPLVSISVNLSSKQLRDPYFAVKVQQVLLTTGLNPSYLDLELTENIIMENPEQTINLLELLKTMGLKLSVDDFGTGYSSLSHLKRFPLTTLKIDRSFVADCPENEQDAAIISAITSLSHSLNLNVVAEGVETQAQLDILTALNCDTVQGYFFSAPVPADKVFSAGSLKSPVDVLKS